MKKTIVFLLVLIVPFFLTGCSMVDSDETVAEKYCEQFPKDEGCINDGEPTGIISDDSEVCTDGYILQNNICVIVNDDPIDTVNCDSGYHEEDEQCVPDTVSEVCENNLIFSDGNCIETCDLPIDDTNYFPCFRECTDEFPCTYHKLVLTGGNSYFESFVMWIKHTYMNDSAEFELHHVLKGETNVIISQGGFRTWCNPDVVGCEDLYKSTFNIITTTGEFKYTFSFWYDESWYTEVQEISYDVWNSETNDYDIIDIDIQIFYLQDSYNTD